MTSEELAKAAEAKLRDADRNLAGCVDAMAAHRARHGGVPNAEVIAVAHAQAALAQGYALLAIARGGDGP